MSSQSGKGKPELGLESLSDRLRNSLTCDDGANKPDFRELDVVGSPVSPLRGGTAAATTTTTTTTTTSSSSSSSGSVSGRMSLGQTANLPRNRDSIPTSHSGELQSSPSSVRNLRRGHNRSYSSGSQAQMYTSSGSGSGSVTSPTVNVLPAGNICPSGRIVKTGMASRSTKSDVMGSGSGNYGHGSIMRGGITSKQLGVDSSSPVSYSKGLMVGGEQGRRIGPYGSNDPEELKRMGNDNYRKGNFTEALSLYDKAIAICPGNAAFHFNRAAALIGLKRLVEAVRECEEAIRLDPGYVRAHHRLGSLFLSLGQIENARKHIGFAGHQPDPGELQKLQSIEKHLSRCIDARRVGDWRGMLKEVEAAIASGADASPQLFACRAEALMKLHRLDDAFQSMPSVPRSGTNLPFQSKIFGILSEAYIYLVGAQIELAMGRFDGAMAAIDRARQIDPHNSEITSIHNNVKLVSRARARGNDLFKSERFTEACSAYGEGLRLDPSNSVLYCNRAACWFKLSLWERSLDDCNQALCFQPNYMKALLRRAASNVKLERWYEAVRDYEVLRRELPNDNDVAESLFHAQVALKKSRGEEVYNMKFGGEVEAVLGLDQFRAAISSPGASVVHFKSESNADCKLISPVLDTLCSRYPSVNFLKVDVDESSEIARAESVRITPTFKIYRKGARVKEMICPSPEVLESSVRHYSI